ncbi:hypothetical protein K402DRAFT_392595 [Aulographum hederae CBS 113979]|uniref:Uncharacterized protein n=1 Tax=Aulographum hederae CBS 113979 TaxID=1176131 RepID=A0A6G1H3R5_9PEZI|nr:hypothetical protein K402DRAFT_392595 [Aulographum hederae CBS 113979]
MSRHYMGPFAAARRVCEWVVWQLSAAVMWLLCRRRRASGDNADLETGRGRVSPPLPLSVVHPSSQTETLTPGPMSPGPESANSWFGPALVRVAAAVERPTATVPTIAAASTSSPLIITAPEPAQFPRTHRRPEEPAPFPMFSPPADPPEVARPPPTELARASAPVVSLPDNTPEVARPPPTQPTRVSTPPKPTSVLPVLDQLVRWNEEYRKDFKVAKTQIQPCIARQPNRKCHQERLEDINVLVETARVCEDILAKRNLLEALDAQEKVWEEMLRLDWARDTRNPEKSREMTNDRKAMAGEMKPVVEAYLLEGKKPNGKGRATVEGEEDKMEEMYMKFESMVMSERLEEAMKDAFFPELDAAEDSNIHDKKAPMDKAAENLKSDEDVMRSIQNDEDMMRSIQNDEDMMRSIQNDEDMMRSIQNDDECLPVVANPPTT